LLGSSRLGNDTKVDTVAYTQIWYKSYICCSNRKKKKNTTIVDLLKLLKVLTNYTEHIRRANKMWPVEYINPCLLSVIWPHQSKNNARIVIFSNKIYRVQQKYTTLVLGVPSPFMWEHTCYRRRPVEPYHKYNIWKRKFHMERNEMYISSI
jgi:hypothetical protein